MNIYSIIRIIAKQIKWLIILPIITATLMFFLTEDQPKEYTTKSTFFSGIASGSSLSNLDNNRVDYFASKTAYNNLITLINSRKVIEETSLRLFALHLSTKNPGENIISAESYEAIISELPPEIKDLVVEGDIEETYENFSNYISQDSSNFLYGLINFDHPFYSHKAISSIKTSQVDGSDIIQLTYKSSDAGIAYHTLSILMEVFLREYGKLKVNQASAVIAYFEKQLQKASLELNNAEDRLLNFNKDNQIINYYEQTKHISSQQEKIEIKLHDIVLEYEASQAILAKLEAKTQSRFNIDLKNKEIIELREELIVVNRDLAALEINSINDTIKSEAPKSKLLLKKGLLESQMEQKIDSLYIYDKRSDGIAIETLLDDWLRNVIEFESARARLQAMESKREEFNKLYNQFAPLGASLKRIEREIEVKEESYLEILHHLGLAKLKQQNEELMADMKILDPPFLPINSEPTKRMMMVGVIGVFTFLFTLLGLFVFELLDRTIKTKERLEEHTKYETFATIPLKGKRKLDWNTLNQKGLKLVVDIIQNKRSSKDYPELLFVQVFSHLNYEGKSYTINLISDMLITNGYKVLKSCFVNDNDYEKFNVIDNSHYNSASYNQIINNASGYDIVLIEIPSLANEAYFINSTLLKTADLNLIIFDAARTWSNHDNFIQSHFYEQTNIKPLSILNKTLPENMVDIIGEIPKQRTRIRQFIKNQIVKKYIS